MILVTGATGTTGKEVVKQLSTKGIALRALVRDPDRGHKILGPGVQIARGDLGDRASLDAAVDECDSVFLLSSADPRQVELQGNVIEAAVRGGARRVVKLGALGASADSPISLARAHFQTEQQLAGSGLQYTNLRPTMFMQNMFMSAATIQSEGKIYAPMQNGKVSFVDARDIASVAVAALTEERHDGETYDITGGQALSHADLAGVFSEVLGREVTYVAVAALTEERHDGETYDITGGQALSHADLAGVFSEVLGREVTYVDVPPEAARQGMLSGGMPEWLADDLLKLMTMVFAPGHGAAVADTVARVTGRAPITFRRFVQDHAAAFQPAG